MSCIWTRLISFSWRWPISFLPSVSIRCPVPACQCLSIRLSFFSRFSAGTDFSLRIITSLFVFLSQIYILIILLVYKSLFTGLLNVSVLSWTFDWSLSWVVSLFVFRLRLVCVELLLAYLRQRSWDTSWSLTDFIGNSVTNIDIIKFSAISSHCWALWPLTCCVEVAFFSEFFSCVVGWFVFFWNRVCIDVYWFWCGCVGGRFNWTLAIFLFLWTTWSWRSISFGPSYFSWFVWWGIRFLVFLRFLIFHCHWLRFFIIFWRAYNLTSISFSVRSLSASLNICKFSSKLFSLFVIQIYVSILNLPSSTFLKTYFWIFMTSIFLTSSTSVTWLAAIWRWIVTRSICKLIVWVNSKWTIGLKLTYWLGWSFPKS